MRLLAALALTLSMLTAARAGAQELGLPVGSKAPAAAVQTLDGKVTNLSQWVGKTPVLIEFWASWCPNCKALEPAIEAAHRAYGSRVKFVGVAVSVNQSPERVRRHLARHEMPLEMVYDHDGEATSAYDVPATSYVVILDRAGRVVYTGLGEKQDLVAALRKAGF
ncbi:MAG TPA: TlpA disulfide reductase family protein [Gemmatimonadales bacterium]